MIRCTELKEGEFLNKAIIWQKGKAWIKKSIYGYILKNEQGEYFLLNMDDLRNIIHNNNSILIEPLQTNAETILG